MDTPVIPDFHSTLRKESPLQLVGAINAYCALLAKEAGFNAIYLSGAGVANASFGLPDLGVTTLDAVCEEVRRISTACQLPLLVDADTGWDDPGKTVIQLQLAGAAGIHLEDQVESKRCGHRPGKQLVSPEIMSARLNSAIAARENDHFIIMARTDAYSVEGLDAAIERAQQYIEAGADMIFAEAFKSLDEYKKFTQIIKVPVLANMTEFGNTPLFTVEELANAGIQIVLYPLSAFRAMSNAAIEVYSTIRKDGTQINIINKMQSRDDLYKILNYYEQEDTVDKKLD